jgi:hypothetical protein
MSELFDYKIEMEKKRMELKRRIAGYALAHPEIVMPTICKLFNVALSLAEAALRASGIKRGSGRRSFHIKRAK